MLTNRAATEAVSRERDRDHRTHHGRDQGRKEGDLQTLDHRATQLRETSERMQPVLQRESLPGVVERVLKPLRLLKLNTTITMIGANR